ncbi:MAG: restriction endonuclease subunit S, partial [Patescibacteria group bacterium]|nr:restriction endonuclease subunit S [Patescibacteria group bacterium]
ESINEYILIELSFTLPQIDDKICYVTHANSVKENRLDPRFYKKHYIEFEKMLNSRSDVEPISKISDDVNSGSTPKSGGDAYTTKEDGGVPFIRIVNISHGKINLKNVLYIKRNIHEKMLKRTQLKPNDVLLSIAGTIGVSVVVPKEISEANINQALVKLTLKDGVNPHYISAILNSPIGRMQTDRFSRPSVQTNINLAEISALKIPLTKDTEQNRIAKEIQSRFEIVENLRSEGENILKEAKFRVNKLLLE